jgi:SNF2 family DNA or RNA helicase
MILKPPKTQIATVARLTAGQHGVMARLPEINEAFRLAVRGMGYRWDGKQWYRGLDGCSGPIGDRLLETAAALYQAGFAIEMEDGLAARLRVGDWKPEQKRWVITAGDKLGLRWRGQDDRLYLRAQMLPESRWDKEHKAVTVPVLYYAEVRGFAEEHDFAVAPEAQAMLERAERDYARTLLPALPDPVGISKPKRGKQRFCDPAKFADLPARNVQTLTELYRHQLAAVEKLTPMRVGALFMDMGTGKTRCAIELAAARQARISRVIWFCPVSLKLTIAAEIAKHTRGEAVHVFDDTSGNGELPEAFWYVVGIESMSSSDRVVLAVNRLMDADTFVIVDESSYIKGHASKRSMRIAEIGKRARYRLLLTGTPITQGVEDLYAQMRFLSPDILGYGSYYSFARNHLEYSEKFPGMIVRAHHVEGLADKIAPYTYQVTKAECLDLPDKLYDRVYFHLSDEQRAAYEQAKWEILMEKPLEELDSHVIFKLFTALQQIVSGFWKREGELIELKHGRLAMLQTVIGGIPETEKVIIWCKFVHSVEQIAAALPGCARYFGELKEKPRAAELERFRGEECRFLVATQATGGHGLTLNEACYHVFYENEFKYGHRIQAEDRSHRIGQTRVVTYIDVVSNSGIDERIQKALEKKEDVLRSFRSEVQKVKDVRI